jgi:hypothetical protein
MYCIESFGFGQGHVQALQPPQFESGIIDPLNDVTCVAGAHRIRLDDSKG